MKPYYLSSDAGQIFKRHRYFDNRIKELKEEIKNCDPSDMNFKFGRLDAITEGKGKLHKALVDEIIDVKKQIAANKDFDEIISEIDYLKGYMKGIEEILNYDRQIFEGKSNFILFIYSNSEDSLSKYREALYGSDIFTEDDEPNKIKYSISTDADEICDKIMQLDNDTEYVICVIYNKQNMVNKEIMQQLSFGRNRNVFLLSDNVAMRSSVKDVIKKLIKSTII